MSFTGTLYPSWLKGRFRYDGDCILWTGTLNESGYGIVSVEGRNWRVHRIAYVMVRGAIPEGLTLDHTCRKRACFNVSHLDPVTRGENVLRGEGDSAQRARQTECWHGHAFDAENTYIDKNGYRKCRSCDRERHRVYRQTV